jgi:RNA polymerase sigma factor (TIGR02999 family)
MSDSIQIVSEAEQGGPFAAEQLLPLVYNELRRLASSKLAGEKPGHTLQATALVHEAYLRLVNVEKVQDWNSRSHFFIAAAEAMRRILIESARRKRRLKYGGDYHRAELVESGVTANASPNELLAIDDALTKLAADDPLAADLVKLRYFAGLNIEEAAKLLSISRATAYRHWTYARAWIRCEVLDDDASDSS